MTTSLKQQSLSSPKTLTTSIVPSDNSPIFYSYNDILTTINNIINCEVTMSYAINSNVSLPCAKITISAFHNFISNKPKDICANILVEFLDETQNKMDIARRKIINAKDYYESKELRDMIPKIRRQGQVARILLHELIVSLKNTIK